VSESVLYPREYNQVNVGGTVTLMEAMRDVGVHRVVLASSGAVYGNQPVQPVNESAIPNPRSPYAVSKLSAEYYVKTIGSLWGIETVCLRIFNAYGPGQRIPPVHTPVIPGFLRQAWENGTLVVHGDGNQTRDFVYIDDVVTAMIAAATASDVNQSIINIGSGAETSLRELVHEVLEVTGGNPEVVYNPRNEGGLSRLCADIQLAHDKLDYDPITPLADGLKATLEYELTSRQQGES
jgi:UDP-glucose 4-epimerase